jgi:hypothetical protein
MQCVKYAWTWWKDNWAQVSAPGVHKSFCLGQQLEAPSFAWAECCLSVSFLTVSMDTTQIWSLNIKRTLTTDACSVLPHFFQFWTLCFSIIYYIFLTFVPVIHTSCHICLQVVPFQPFRQKVTCVVSHDKPQMCRIKPGSEQRPQWI